MRCPFTICSKPLETTIRHDKNIQNTFVIDVSSDEQINFKSYERYPQAANQTLDDESITNGQPVASAEATIARQKKVDNIMTKIFKDRKIYRRDCDRSPLYANENFDTPWTIVSR